jgi:hypothetical protein
VRTPRARTRRRTRPPPARHGGDGPPEKPLLGRLLPFLTGNGWEGPGRRAAGPRPLHWSSSVDHSDPSYASGGHAGRRAGTERRPPGRDAGLRLLDPTEAAPASPTELRCAAELPPCMASSSLGTIVNKQQPPPRGPLPPIAGRAAPLLAAPAPRLDAGHDSD